ncbi:hypothetical protein [Flavilitoribacter nigricans]|uniref:hypothetical protein n=1 Tax=Flavilitoribacter nigricans TaxID=70997 RepID=UPI00117B6CAA|nr:hypothetical protein [Flavilitoribacter nigricans]
MINRLGEGKVCPAGPGIFLRTHEAVRQLPGSASRWKNAKSCGCREPDYIRAVFGYLISSVRLSVHSRTPVVQI